MVMADQIVEVLALHSTLHTVRCVPSPWWILLVAHWDTFFMSSGVIDPWLNKNPKQTPLKDNIRVCGQKDVSH